MREPVSLLLTTVFFFVSLFQALVDYPDEDSDEEDDEDHEEDLDDDDDLDDGLLAKKPRF
mgnify:CR=1 FL=1